jgi:hypothetical protein
MYIYIYIYIYDIYIYVYINILISYIYICRSYWKEVELMGESIIHLDTYYVIQMYYRLYTVVQYSKEVMLKHCRVHPDNVGYGCL